MTRRTPRRIIALTANAQAREDEDAAIEAGLDGFFLAKPFPTFATCRGSSRTHPARAMAGTASYPGGQGAGAGAAGGGVAPLSPPELTARSLSLRNLPDIASPSPRPPIPDSAPALRWCGNRPASGR